MGQVYEGTLENEPVELMFCHRQDVIHRDDTLLVKARE